MLQSLLTDPNPASPANPEAAQLYQHDIQAYNKFVNVLEPICFSSKFMTSLEITLCH